MKSPTFRFLINRILCSPLESLFTLLIFILSKNLGATPLQLTIIACIKPISALFSFYISSFIFDQQHRMRTYLLINNICGCILCFFYPFVQNVWFYVFSYAAFMICRKAVTPAWMEIIKNHVSAEAMTKVVSKSNSIYYTATLALPPVICFWIDLDVTIWKSIFIAFSGLQILNVILISMIDKSILKAKQNPISISFSSVFVRPLKQAWTLLLEKPAFRQYQILYFLGGASVVFIQPILPIYFKDSLNLSYSQLGLAYSFCRGLAFIATSPLWVNWIRSNSLFKLLSHVNLLICLHILSLLLSGFAIEWLYLAYIFYGITQAGGELTWHLSGPVFSKEKDSTLYSGVNLALVGLRGCFCPLISYMLFSATNAQSVFILSFMVCFIGIFYGRTLDKRYETTQAIQGST